MDKRSLLAKSLEKNGPLCSIREVADQLHVSRSFIWNMTFVPDKCHKKHKIVRENQRKYIKGDNLYGLYMDDRSIMITQSSVEKYLQTHVMRDSLGDRTIIENACKSLLILGINGLGPLHQNRELIINLLKNGGSVKVLLLDPRSDSFEERVHFEKCFDNQMTNRLMYEFLASVSLCKEIFECVGNIKSPAKKGHPDDSSPFCKGIPECTNPKCDLILKLYSSKPEMSLVIADHEGDMGILNMNSYPKIKGSRGMTVRSIQLKKREESDRDYFNGLIKKYFDMFNSSNADEVDFTINPVKYLKYNPLVVSNDISE